MPESQDIPGKKQATIGLILAAISFLYLMFVPLYVTSFFTLIISIIGLIQAIRAKKLGYIGMIRTVGLLVAVLDIALSLLLIIIPIIAVSGIQS